MVTALTTLAGGAASALATQQKKQLPARPEVPSSIPYLATAKNKRQRDHILTASREERLWNLITQPEVIGMVMTLAGIYAVQNIKFSDNKIANEGLQATATSAAVLMGLGHAGVGDITTTVVAGLAGFSSLAESATEIAKDVFEEFPDIGFNDTPETGHGKLDFLMKLLSFSPMNPFKNFFD